MTQGPDPSRGPTTLTLEERTTRLETAYEYPATKADFESLRADLHSTLAAFRDSTNNRIDQLNSRIDRIFWAVIGTGGGLLAVAVAALLWETLT